MVDRGRLFPYFFSPMKEETARPGRKRDRDLGTEVWDRVDGETLLRLRRRRELTQIELSRRLGWKSGAVISRIESGERPLLYRQLRQYVRQLGFTMDHFEDWRSGTVLDWRSRLLEKDPERAADEIDLAQARKGRSGEPGS